MQSGFSNFNFYVYVCILYFFQYIQPEVALPFALSLSAPQIPLCSFLTLESEAVWLQGVEALLCLHAVLWLLQQPAGFRGHAVTLHAVSFVQGRSSIFCREAQRQHCLMEAQHANQSMVLPRKAFLHLSFLFSQQYSHVAGVSMRGGSHAADPQSPAQRNASGLWDSISMKMMEPGTLYSRNASCCWRSTERSAGTFHSSTAVSGQ